VRRGFYDLAKAKAPIAIEALKRIAALYAIEADIRGKSANERQIARQAESKPLITELRVWFEAQRAKLPARGPTAEAIRYALNHWDGLQRFLDDGRLELDTNTVERAMRPVALGRKNALFAGADVGASYCSSGDVLIKQESFGGNFENSGAGSARRQHRGERHPGAGRQAGLSRALLRTTAGVAEHRR
jgi:transposase